MSRLAPDRWRNSKQGSLIDSAGAAAYRAWAIALAATKNLHEENYHYTSDRQRLDVISEYLFVLVHCADRLCIQHFASEKRHTFIQELSLSCARHLQRNANEILESDNHRKPFIDLLNARTTEYAQYSFDKLEPCFGLLKSLGKNIQQVMGESQTNRWVTDQIITVDGPDAVRLFMDILRNLLEHQIKQGLGDSITES